MDCDMFAKLLENYENLTEQEKAMLESHAEECSDCKRELDFMASILSSMKTLPEIDVPPDFLSGVNAELDRYEKKRTLSHFARNWQKYSAAAACIALLAVVGVNGDFLVDRMTGDDGGIISEERADTPATAEPAAQPSVKSEKNDNANTAVADGKADENTSSADRNTETGNGLAGKSAVKSGISSYGTSGKSVSGGTASNHAVFEKSGISAASDSVLGASAENVKSNAKTENTADNTENTSAKPSGTAEVADTAASVAVSEATAAPEITEKPEDYGIAAQSDIPKIAEATESEPLEEDDITAYSEDTEQDGGKARSGNYALNLKGTENKYAIASGVDNSGTSDGVLMISSEDYNRAMGIIMGYISSDGEGYYTASADSFYSMLSELYNSDIAFENLITETGNDVRFKIMSY